MRIRTTLTLMAAILGLLGACRAGELEEENRDLAGPGQADRELAADGPLRLTPATEWLRINPADTFMVSPRWSSSGDWLLMSGRMGVGLYVRNPTTGAYTVLDDGYQGPAEWLADRDGVCLRDQESGSWRIFDPTTRSRRNDDDDDCPDNAWDDNLGAPIHRDAAATWFHHPKGGSVSVKRADGQVDTVVAAEAWGVRVAANGASVAYSTGPLADSSLFLVDLEAGVTRELGPGAYPIWVPSDGLLVFASPGELAPFGEGKATFDSAELLIYDPAIDELHLLTATSDIAEMEPALSSDGTRLAFSDWRDGAVYVARLSRGGSR